MSSYQILRPIAFSGACSTGKCKVQEMRLKCEAYLSTQDKGESGWMRSPIRHYVGKNECPSP